MATDLENDIVDIMSSGSERIDKYIECSCSCSEHTMRFSWYDGPDEREMYLHIFLNNKCGFWKRLWYGIKYIFGFKSAYGHFDEVIMRHQEVTQLNSLCEEWLKKHIKPPLTPKEEYEVARLVVLLKQKSLDKAIEKQNEALNKFHKEDASGQK